MLAPAKLKIVQDLIASSTKEELIWINGFLTGVVGGTVPSTETGSKAPVPAAKITIAYGTETGNSKKLAAGFATIAKGKGFQAKLVSLDQYRLNDLAKEEYFFAVISTQGDGEPPAAAKKFFDHIHLNGFRLEKMKFGVLALGDTSYPLFCKAGEDVDSQLQKLGAERIIGLQKCDTDYEADADAWFNNVLSSLGTDNKPAAGTITAAPPRKPAGKKIFKGTVLANINLNDTGSSKRTHHIEISSEDLDYQPGDAIGIVPPNRKADVDRIVEVAGIDASRIFVYKDHAASIEQLLLNKLSIVHLPERVISKYLQLVDAPATPQVHDLIDLLTLYPLKNPAQFDELLNILEPIVPRLYSIASSLEAHSGEVHITVALDSFELDEARRLGLCSEYLVDLEENAVFDFYVQRNNSFRLPAPEKDVIMVGPGTGIAPFRSFLAERDATGAAGRNWLFFGDQHFETDFLYQTELQSWHETGLLSRINVAFSRDQKEKVYVQHKMRKHARDLFEWLESGANFYICGAKDPMSEDVENTLLEIIREQGNKSEQEALDYLDNLKEEGRYHKDVY